MLVVVAQAPLLEIKKVSVVDQRVGLFCCCLFFLFIQTRFHGISRQILALVEPTGAFN